MLKNNFGLFSDPYKIGGNPHTGSEERTTFTDYKGWWLWKLGEFENYVKATKILSILHFYTKIQYIKF